MTIAGLWRYGNWRHVATGCTALVAIALLFYSNSKVFILCSLLVVLMYDTFGIVMLELSQRV